MATASQQLPSQTSAWTTERILDLVQCRLKKRPCWYQIEVAKAFFAGRDVIGCAPTGAGKTLSYWIPLLMAQAEGMKKILFVVSPSNVLAKQNIITLSEVGIQAVAIAAENAFLAKFSDIAQGKYEVVMISPEILVTSDELRSLWKNPSFTRQILGIVFDDMQGRIVQWGKAVGWVRYFINDPIPFYVASATLPSPLLVETRKLLNMHSGDTIEVVCSNDRPDIALMVRALNYPASSYKDLAFLIPYNWNENMSAPRKFLVFFDNEKEAEGAKHFFRQRLLEKYHSKIAWFHPTMSQEYRELKVEELRRGDIWGLFCTDAFRLEMDVGDIEIVVQYKATCDLCTLWHRFGRAARSPDAQGVGILLVEEKDLVAPEKNPPAPSKQSNKDEQEGTHKHQQVSPGSSTQSTMGRETEEGSGIDTDTAYDATSKSLSTSSDSEAAWLCERQARYAMPEVKPKDPANSKKGRAPGLLPGTVMHDYVNASLYVSCRRLIPKLYFGGNNEVSDGHHRCDPGETQGCQRCRPKTMNLCCDLCSPHSFTAYCTPRDQADSKTTKTSWRSVIPSWYTRDLVPTQLEDAIYAWRDEQAVKSFGEGIVHRLGAGLFMTEDTLGRILACWTTGKLTELSHFSKETAWPRESIEKYGQSLLDVLTVYPPDSKLSSSVAIDLNHS